MLRSKRRILCRCYSQSVTKIFCALKAIELKYHPFSIFLVTKVSFHYEDPEYLMEKKRLSAGFGWGLAATLAMSAVRLPVTLRGSRPTI